jgi:adenylate cyclase
VSSEINSERRSNSNQVKQSVVLPLILGTAALLALLTNPNLPTGNIAAGFDRDLLDKFHEMGRMTAPREGIVVMGLDDASLTLSAAWPEDIAASPTLQAMKQVYPWPRRVWAQLIDRLCDAGAKAVFLDLAFIHESDPEDDRLLGEAFRRHPGKVVLGGKFDISVVGQEELSELVLPNPSIVGTATFDDGGIGLLNFWMDEDHVLRTANFLRTRAEAAGGILDPTEKPLPSVARLLASIADPACLKGVQPAERLRFCNPAAYNPRSLHEVFVPGLWEANYGNGKFFKDKIVLVGAAAQQLQDYQKTPVGTIFGVQLHAQALTALLNHSFVYSTKPQTLWIVFFLAVLLAWLVVTLVRQPVLSLLAMIILAGAAYIVSVLLFNYHGIEFSPLRFIVPFVACGLAAEIGDFLVQLAEKRKLHRALIRYTSAEFVNEMLKDREGIYTTLGGVERVVTVLFSDVRGFTSMSENMTPHEVVSQLNEYLTRMVEHVPKNRGVVDKFIGDAVMALWGSMRARSNVDDLKRDAFNAVTSALAMLKALDELNAGWKLRGIAELRIGIGIHQGSVIAGNIGAASPMEKMDITVIGDSVNLASRLEGVTKEYGVDLIISDAVQQQVKEDFLCRSADLVKVKGKAKPVEVFAVVGPHPSEPLGGLAAYEQGVSLYRQGNFTGARDAFVQATNEGLKDELTSIYIKRCETLIQNPPEDWDGVYVMTKK